MSPACPIISSRNSSLPEVGAEAVCYWDGESAGTLAEAMLRLEEDEEMYLRLSREGLQRDAVFLVGENRVGTQTVLRSSHLAALKHKWRYHCRPAEK